METPTTVIELPSRGVFYPEENPLSNGTVEIKYMTAREEDILTDQNLLKQGLALDKLIESVVVDPTVNTDDLLLGDKGAIVLAARISAYGPHYQFTVDCPECGERNTVNVNLAEIEAKDIDFSQVEQGQNEFEIELPATEVTATVKLLTHKDDKIMRNELKKVKRSSGPNDVRVQTQITTRLKHFIVALNGDRSKDQVRRFVDNMPARDSFALRQFIQKINPDIDLSTHFVCDFCGYDERVDIPLDANFFFPSTEV